MDKRGEKHSENCELLAFNKQNIPIIILSKFIFSEFPSSFFSNELQNKTLPVLKKWF